ncbi:hypothetical protein BEP19_07875 [Ammoniphilus oxalaticus]|uniref:PhiEco32-like amidoligase-type 2 protein n=1 Tax=Ammoniphilus oxalaticus TaxID=66863 RepID=A0A419SL38_9BACL|nr:hypothetical protein BEP19_07875 [Ammoniphilus oxalaticus]
MAQLSAQDPNIHVLNGEEGLHNVSNRKMMLEILRWNGIQTIHEETSASKISTIRRYFIPVFQQQELALFRSQGKKVWLTNELSSHSSDTYEEIEITRSIREIRRILQLAVRSVYCLGLDFGGVLIGIGLNGTLNVIDVTPTPKLNQSLAEKFGKAFEQYVRRYKDPAPSPVVMGADPEFVLRNKSTGKMVLASRFFGRKGPVGCDQIWLRGDQTRQKLPLAELRPEPASEPRQLTLNLYRTMLLAEKKIDNASIEWLAGGMPMKGYPIGGHIHFSQTKVNSHFLRALDSYLCLPLMIIENQHSLGRRPKYGFLGDYRNQFHGGFEYRPLPSWLVSPRVTKGTLALAKLIAESYPRLNLLPTYYSSIQEAFYKGNKRKILQAVKANWVHLEKLDDYRTYKKYIEPLREMIFNQEEWNEFGDIRQAWKIRPFSAKRTISNMI